ncbi:MAG: response regulator transcription factor [Actinomycetota bacterium]
MTSPRILVVDDDSSMRAFVRRNLEARQYEVEECANGMEALATVRHSPVDLVVLDIMMPHLDGYETCRRLRVFSDVPVIVLTAMADERDIVAALDCGADDCLTKPFGVEELMARVRSALRRASVDSHVETEPRINHRDLSFNVAANRVWLAGDELDLTRTELSVLRYYAQHLGKTVPHQQILQAVWGDGYERETHYVRIYVSRLRTKIEQPGDEPYFVTEHGLGYRLG